MKIVLDALRFVKFMLASTFIRKITPADASPDSSIETLQFDAVVGTPELPAMNLFPAGRRIQNSQYHFPEIRGTEMQDVFYYPAQGLVLDRKRRAIEDNTQVPVRKHWYKWKPFFTRDVEQVEGVSCAFRSFGKHHHHLLVDHLPVLYLVEKLGWLNRFRPKLLISEPMSEAEKFFLPRLVPDGMEIHLVQPDRLLQLERYLYVSHLSQRSVGCLPEDYMRWFLERVTPERPRQKTHRIFVSRAGSGHRRIRNEPELLGRLAPHGFRQYTLEDLSMEEQIALFYDAEMVVAPHGAGLTNLLFASQARVLELFPGPLVRPHYYYICKSLNHDYRYLLSRTKNPFPGSLLVDLDEEYNGSFKDFTVDCDQVVAWVKAMGG